MADPEMQTERRSERRRAPLPAGLLERFDGRWWPAAARPGSGGERLRISVRDARGGELRSMTLMGTPGEPTGVRMPLQARRCELAFERSLGDGTWEEFHREAVEVRLLSMDHPKRLGSKVVRDVKTFVARATWFLIRKSADHCPWLVRRLLSGTWQRFVAASETLGPRLAWKEKMGGFDRRKAWLYAYVGDDRLGGLYQYPKSRPVVFDRLPELAVDGRSLPKLTVVTPSYNQGHFLARTMDSVLESADARVDYIVMDGGSKDDSAEVIRKREAKLKHWQSKPDKGQAAAINEGFSHTECGPDDLMAYLNSDDLFCPGAVDFVVKWFALHPEVDAVYGHRIIINEKDEEVGRWVLPPHDPEVLGLVDFVPQETLFWRKRAYDAVGGIDPSFQFAMDWDFLLRLRNGGARIERVPWFLGCFRVHEAQKTQASINDVGAREIEQLRRRENGGEAPAPEVLQEAVMRVQVESHWYAEKIAAGIRV
jgi:hypothetical protein